MSAAVAWQDLPDVPVRMERGHLQDLPHFGLPTGYVLRWYRPGDESHWRRIHAACDGYGELAADLFRQQYGDDDAELARRMAFICDAAGLPVATNTAWFGEGVFRGWGRVHWVATCSAHQRRGLAKPLLAAVCRRLRELGHTRAYLTTNTNRLPALALYRRFGFEPAADTAAEAAAWQSVATAARAQGRDWPAPSAGAPRAESRLESREG